ncbi:glycosyltransferase [Hapalosiphon sp. MRB220]|nr:glycosyltransferase [Hapalosiphon sp. MRB220]
MDNFKYKNKNPKYKTIHLWIPNIFEFKGGIQVYSSFLIEALQSLYPNIKYDVFLKHDTSSLYNFPFLSNTQFHYAGTWSLPLRTLAFASQIIGHGFWQHPDLVIASHINFTLAAYILKSLIGIPYWTVAHGIEAWDIQRPSLKLALQNADLILAGSNYTRNRLLKEQNLDPTKVAVLANTFDVNRFQIHSKPQHLLNRYKLTTSQPVILTVARLDISKRPKGYDQILKALPEVRRQIPNIHYILVGKGSDRPRIEQLINQLDLQECVTLAGFVPDHELSDYYNLCDVFAMPNKTEGFGIVYLEALACGKPVLAGDQGGAIDPLLGGELGVLVNPDDVQIIAQSLIQILQGIYPNPILYQSQTLRQKVIDAFGFERFKQTLGSFI